MREEYMTPELTCVGKVNEVVLGSLGAGNDIRDEFLMIGPEFEAD